VIYFDTSVLLAHVLTEARRPAEEFWVGPVTSSRLVEYESWSRLHVHGLAARLGKILEALLEQTTFLELERPVLARALEPFPVALRTLDALHLASADFLRSRDQDVMIATYDRRMATAARAMGFELHPLW